MARTSLPDVFVIDGYCTRTARQQGGSGEVWHEHDHFTFYCSAGGIPLVAECERSVSHGHWGSWTWAAFSPLGEPLRRKVIATVKRALENGMEVPMAGPCYLAVQATPELFYQAAEAALVAFYRKHFAELPVARWPNGKPNWSAAGRPPRSMSVSLTEVQAWFQFPETAPAPGQLPLAG